MRKLLASLILATFAAAPAWAADNATYDKQCKSCHGADGKGNADKAKVLKIEPEKLSLGSPAAAKLSKDDVKKLILEGKNKMPAYGKKLKPEEVDPLVDHTMEVIKSASAK